MTDLSPLRPNLAITGSAKIVGVDRCRRGTLGAAITFDWPHAEFFFECRRDPFREFLGSSHDEAQTTEILGHTGAQIKLQKSRGRQQERDLALAHERPNGFGV